MSSNSSLLIAQITDTHLFASAETSLLGLQTNETFQAVLEQVMTLEQRPDLFMLTGDLSQDGTVKSYKRLAMLLQPLGIPVYCIPGNHDCPTTMQAILTGVPFVPEKSLRLGGWQLILLDSSVPECVHGAVSPESLDWLEQELSHAPETPTLIALHHPPLQIGSQWMDGIGLTNAQEFLEVCDRHSQIRLILFGHIHQEFSHYRNGVTYLGTPSTCVQFKPNTADFTLDKQPPGYRLVNLYPGGNWKTQVQRISYRCNLDLAATGY
ncbi:3',5'-cyclic-AMP phosphodiesterase [Leptodesmis sp.]|uniref:3',5'-cyclic-AMP phosphodiesterase n=1 Tax=Leptodesmis sp. TaxID=3100501 RepID=UPI0040534623